jgi:hypothetical protein
MADDPDPLKFPASAMLEVSVFVADVLSAGASFAAQPDRTSALAPASAASLVILDMEYPFVIFQAIRP